MTTQEEFMKMSPQQRQRLEEAHYLIQLSCNPESCPLCWREKNCAKCEKVNTEENQIGWTSYCPAGVVAFSLCPDCKSEISDQELRELGW